MIANMHKWEIPEMERSMTPPFPSISWAGRVVNNSNIAARRETPQEKDTKKNFVLGRIYASKWWNLQTKVRHGQVRRDLVGGKHLIETQNFEYLMRNFDYC